MNWWNRWKTSLAATAAGAALALAGPAAVGAGAEGQSAQPQAVPATGDVAEFVSARVEALQPKAAERTFDQVGWLTDLRQALALAGEHDRPVFLFTHDGRMALGRC